MLDGKDLRQLPLVKRKQRLARLLTGHPRLFDVEHIEKEGLAMFAGALTLGLEGIVAKDATLDRKACLPAFPSQALRFAPTITGLRPQAHGKSHLVNVLQKHTPRNQSKEVSARSHS